MRSIIAVRARRRPVASTIKRIAVDARVHRPDGPRQAVVRLTGEVGGILAGERRVGDHDADRRVAERRRPVRARTRSIGSKPRPRAAAHAGDDAPAHRVDDFAERVDRDDRLDRTTARHCLAGDAEAAAAAVLHAGGLADRRPGAGADAPFGRAGTGRRARRAAGSGIRPPFRIADAEVVEPAAPARSECRRARSADRCRARSASARRRRVAARPNTLPPASTTPCTRRGATPRIGARISVSREHGAPPRTATPPTAPRGHSTTVQPVAPTGSD